MSKRSVRVLKTDKNHAQIMRELRALGFSVADTHTVGGGFPDLVVAWDGITMLVEVKSPGGKLTPDESSFIEHWDGEVVVATCSEDVVEAFNCYRMTVKSE